MEHDDLKRALSQFSAGAKSLRHSREAASGAARVSLPDGNVMTGQAVNISSGGIGILVDEDNDKSLFQSAKVTLSVVWPEDKTLDVAAEIAWIGDDGLLGLVFRDLDEETTDTIQRLMLAGIVDRTLKSE